MDRSAEHRMLVGKILALSAGRLDLVLFELRTGAAISFSGNFFKYGTNGAADIVGFRGPHGQFVAIEVKTGSGRLMKNQPAFRTAVERCGGIYILARSIDDVLAAGL